MASGMLKIGASVVIVLLVCAVTLENQRLGPSPELTVQIAVKTPLKESEKDRSNHELDLHPSLAPAASAATRAVDPANPPFSFERLVPGTYGPGCPRVRGGEIRQLVCEFNSTLQSIQRCNEPETAGGTLRWDDDHASLVWSSHGPGGTPKACGGDEYYVESRPFGSEEQSAPNKQIYFNDHSFISNGEYEFKMRGHPFRPPGNGTRRAKTHALRNRCPPRNRKCQEIPAEYPPEPILGVCCPSLRKPLNISVSLRLHYSNGWGMLAPPGKVDIPGPHAANKVLFEGTIMIYTCDQPKLLSDSMAAKEAAAINAGDECIDGTGVDGFRHWVFFGDSLTEHMYAVTPPHLGRSKDHDFWYIPRLPSPTNTIHNPRLPLTNTTVARSTYRSMIENFTHAGVLTSLPGTAVMLSSGMWEVLSDVHYDFFLGHVEAFAEFLDVAMQKFPGATFVVKNVNAVHLHRAAKCTSKCQLRLKYMSNSRVALLNQLQAVHIRARGMVLFDQYTFTSTIAHRTKRNDARHFNIWGNVVLWSVLHETMKAATAHKHADEKRCPVIVPRLLACSADGVTPK